MAKKKDVSKLFLCWQSSYVYIFFSLQRNTETGYSHKSISMYVPFEIRHGFGLMVPDFFDFLRFFIMLYLDYVTNNLALDFIISRNESWSLSNLNKINILIIHVFYCSHLSVEFQEELWDLLAEKYFFIFYQRYQELRSQYESLGNKI
jgi:hypothetical protein